MGCAEISRCLRAEKADFAQTRCLKPGPQCESEAEMIEEIRARRLQPAPGRHLPLSSTGSSIRRLRVHGVEHLRVNHAAGSRRQHQRASIMIGEKCAPMVLEDAMAA